MNRLPRRRARALLELVVCGAAAIALGPIDSPLTAQQTDSARVALPQRPPPNLTRDTTVPPISPRRAFLYSLAVPGLGQTKLQRPTAASVFMTIEVFSIVMAKKAGYDLREARERQRDSIPDYYELNANGTAKLDPKTGEPIFVPARNRFAGNRVRARRTHYEDWIAGIVFNHLFAGADAFVAAQLWDLPAQVAARRTRGGVTVTASLRW